ncbi:MAG: twin-arginine translocase TatA/TatE family subunit [Thermoleophilia bacterium]
MFSNIGIWEILLLLLVLLLVFGPKRLPEMGRSLGRGMREFKDSITGKVVDDEEPDIAPATGAQVVGHAEIVDVAPVPVNATIPATAAVAADAEGVRTSS